MLQSVRLLGDLSFKRIWTRKLLFLKDSLLTCRALINFLKKNRRQISCFLVFCTTQHSCWSSPNCARALNQSVPTGMALLWQTPFLSALFILINGPVKFSAIWVISYQIYITHGLKLHFPYRVKKCKLISKFNVLNLTNS